MPHAAIILVSPVSTLYCNAQALLQGARVGVRKQAGFIYSSRQCVLCIAMRKPCSKARGLESA